MILNSTGSTFGSDSETDRYAMLSARGKWGSGPAVPVGRKGGRNRLISNSYACSGGEDPARGRRERRVPLRGAPQHLAGRDRLPSRPDPLGVVRDLSGLQSFHALGPGPSLASALLSRAPAELASRLGNRDRLYGKQRPPPSRCEKQQGDENSSPGEPTLGAHCESQLPFCANLCIDNSELLLAHTIPLFHC